MRPGLADIKLPWELGRCQHWVPLAQAFRADRRRTLRRGDRRDQHDDFMDANPIGIGDPMDAARWTSRSARSTGRSAFELIQSRTVRTRRAPRSALYRSLFDHGVFIERNLENTYEVTSNHFLSNVVGLYGVGAGVRRSAVRAALDRAVPRMARAGNARPGAARRRRLRVVCAVPPAGRRAVSGRLRGWRNSRARRCRTTYRDQLRRDGRCSSPPCCGRTA